MRRIAMAIATAGFIAGSLTGLPTAGAASTNNITPAPAPVQPFPAPAIAALDCGFTTGWAGCGPGWIWRNGWRGPACYVC